MSAPPVWFITAASSGFGKQSAIEALNNGHRVIATARRASKIDDLKAKGAVTMDLDVTQPLEELHEIVKKAHAVYGSIDYLVNPAGYVLEGALEEATPQETYDSFNVNVFGVLNVTRAVLPYMRQQKSGVIALFASVASWRGAPGCPIYAGVKWAISGLTESLRAEVAPFGIEVVSVEPGYFRTGFLNPGARIFTATQLKDYDDTTVGEVRKLFNERNNKQLGDVEKGCKVIFDVMTKKNGKPVPIRLPLGTDAYTIIKGKCDETKELLEEWKDIIDSTDHEEKFY